MFTSKQNQPYSSPSASDEQTLTELALTIFDIYLAQKSREAEEVDITTKDTDLSAVGPDQKTLAVLLAL
jgi:hypothetical protein